LYYYDRQIMAIRAVAVATVTVVLVGMLIGSIYEGHQSTSLYSFVPPVVSVDASSLRLDASIQVAPFLLAEPLIPVGIAASSFFVLGSSDSSSSSTTSNAACLLLDVENPIAELIVFPYNTRTLLDTTTWKGIRPDFCAWFFSNPNAAAVVNSATTIGFSCATDTTLENVYNYDITLAEVRSGECHVTGSCGFPQLYNNITEVNNTLPVNNTCLSALPPAPIDTRTMFSGPEPHLFVVKENNRLTILPGTIRAPPNGSCTYMVISLVWTNGISPQLLYTQEPTITLEQLQVGACGSWNFCLSPPTAQRRYITRPRNTPRVHMTPFALELDDNQQLLSEIYSYGMHLYFETAQTSTGAPVWTLVEMHVDFTNKIPSDVSLGIRGPATGVIGPAVSGSITHVTPNETIYTHTLPNPMPPTGFSVVTGLVFPFWWAAPSNPRNQNTSGAFPYGGWRDIIHHCTITGPQNASCPEVPLWAPQYYPGAMPSRANATVDFSFRVSIPKVTTEGFPICSIAVHPIFPDEDVWENTRKYVQAAARAGFKDYRYTEDFGVTGDYGGNTPTYTALNMWNRGVAPNTPELFDDPHFWATPNGPFHGIFDDIHFAIISARLVGSQAEYILERGEPRRFADVKATPIYTIFNTTASTMNMSTDEQFLELTVSLDFLPVLEPRLGIYSPCLTGDHDDYCWLASHDDHIRDYLWQDLYWHARNSVHTVAESIANQIAGTLLMNTTYNVTYSTLPCLGVEPRTCTTHDNIRTIFSAAPVTVHTRQPLPVSVIVERQDETGAFNISALSATFTFASECNAQAIRVVRMGDQGDPARTSNLPDILHSPTAHFDFSKIVTTPDFELEFVLAMYGKDTLPCILVGVDVQIHSIACQRCITTTSVPSVSPWITVLERAIEAGNARDAFANPFNKACSVYTHTFELSNVPHTDRILEWRFDIITHPSSSPYYNPKANKWYATVVTEAHAKDGMVWTTNLGAFGTITVTHVTPTVNWTSGAKAIPNTLMFTKTWNANIFISPVKQTYQLWATNQGYGRACAVSFAPGCLVGIKCPLQLWSVLNAVAKLIQHLSIPFQPTSLNLGVELQYTIISLSPSLTLVNPDDSLFSKIETSHTEGTHIKKTWTLLNTSFNMATMAVPFPNSIIGLDNDTPIWYWAKGNASRGTVWVAEIELSLRLYDMTPNNTKQYVTANNKESIENFGGNWKVNNDQVYNLYTDILTDAFARSTTVESKISFARHECADIGYTVEIPSTPDVHILRLTAPRGSRLRVTGFVLVPQTIQIDRIFVRSMRTLETPPCDNNVCPNIYKTCPCSTYRQIPASGGNPLVVPAYPSSTTFPLPVGTIGTYPDTALYLKNIPVPPVQYSPAGFDVANVHLHSIPAYTYTLGPEMLVEGISIPIAAYAQSGASANRDFWKMVFVKTYGIGSGIGVVVSAAILPSINTADIAVHSADGFPMQIHNDMPSCR
tara:strand:+ start:11078 stop:15466 length:4389 start_codon:yes stop_codon:yes gene_type:complete